MINDGISLFLILLTTLLCSLCILSSWDSVQTNHKEYYSAFLVMEALLVLVFCETKLIQSIIKQIRSTTETPFKVRVQKQ